MLEFQRDIGNGDYSSVLIRIPFSDENGKPQTSVVEVSVHRGRHPGAVALQFNAEADIEIVRKELAASRGDVDEDSNSVRKFADGAIVDVLDAGEFTKARVVRARQTNRGAWKYATQLLNGKDGPDVVQHLLDKWGREAEATRVRRGS